MGRLVLIETHQGFSYLRNFLRENKDIFCASGDEFIVMDLKREGIKVFWLGDFLTSQKLDALDVQAFQMAREWYKACADQQIFIYRGINLGYLAEVSMGGYLSQILKRFARLDHFLKTHPFEELHLLDSVDKGPVGTLFFDEKEAITRSILDLLGFQFIEKIFTGDELEKQRLAVVKDGAKNLIRKVCRSIYDFNRNTNHNLAKQNILLCSAIKHIENLIPLLDENYNILYLDEVFQVSKINFMSAHGIAYHACRGYITEGTAAYLEKFNSQWLSFLNQIQTSSVFSCQGRNIYPVIRSHLDYFAVRMVPELVKQIDFFYDFLGKNKITGLIVDEDVVEFRRCLVSVCRPLKIPSLVLLHATTPTFCRGFDLAPLTADYIAVGGEGIRDDCINYGISPNQVIQTGVPRYDYISRLDRFSCRRAIEGRFGVRLKKETVILAGTYIAEKLEFRGNCYDVERGYRDFFEIMSRYPEKSVIVKLYPMDPYSEWVKRIAFDAGMRDVIFVANYDLPSLIIAADYVATFYSSAVTEAFLLKKPTVVLGYLSRIPPLPPLSRLPGSMFTARKKEELEKILSAFFAKEDDFMKSFTETGAELAASWAGPCDGLASQRVVSLVCKMTSENKLCKTTQNP